MDAQEQSQPSRFDSAVEGEKMQMVTFRAPLELIDRLTTAAGNSRGGRSALIREACERLLGREAA